MSQLMGDKRAFSEHYSHVYMYKNRDVYWPGNGIKPDIKKGDSFHTLNSIAET